MSDTFHSGFVAIIGRPNVGKSTLLNSILGEKIAITTHKPQTTRTRIVGIKNLPEAQIVFMDTPGIHNARGGLNQYMVEVALGTLEDADLILFLADATAEGISSGNRTILEELRQVKTPVFLVLNKVDAVAAKEKLLPRIEAYQGAFNFTEVFPISAMTGEGVEGLVETIAENLPEGPQYFPPDMITDQAERAVAAEIVREKAILSTREEIPYAIAVTVENWEEESGREGERSLVRIDATIHVEKDSQKGIVIGKGGRMLQEIGSRARVDLERFLSSRVFLHLFVRVDRDWRIRQQALRRFGYAHPRE